MSPSTSRRSLNPMPQGAPGVASSMKRPNSGWNTGAVLSPLSRRQRMSYCHIQRKAYSGFPRARSGTPPPCFRSSASLANASRMSACLKESLTCLSWSLNFTTRYSISSPQSRALRSFPFVLRQMASNCYHEYQSPAVSSAVSGQAYLNAPFAHMARLLFCFRPIERRSNGSVTGSVNVTFSFWPALRLRTIVGLGVQQTHERVSALHYSIRAVEGSVSRSLQPRRGSLARSLSFNIAYLFIHTASSLADLAGWVRGG
jgi:hypothetical protein